MTRAASDNNTNTNHTPQHNLPFCALPVNSHTSSSCRCQACESVCWWSKCSSSSSSSLRAPFKPTLLAHRIRTLHTLSHTYTHPFQNRLAQKSIKYFRTMSSTCYVIHTIIIIIVIVIRSRREIHALLQRGPEHMADTTNNNSLEMCCILRVGVFSSRTPTGPEEDRVSREKKRAAVQRGHKGMSCVQCPFQRNRRYHRYNHYIKSYNSFHNNISISHGYATLANFGSPAPMWNLTTLTSIFVHRVVMNEYQGCRKIYALL